MRKKGVTYSGILEQVPVAKSTLALWFKDVKLSQPQTQRITKKRLEAGLRGGLTKKNQRIERAENIISKAEAEIGQISKRELWLIGTTLYWAEGAKEKEWAPGIGLSFINMDPYMVQVFLKWLKQCCVGSEDISFSLYVHKNHQSRIMEIKKYWSKITKFPISRFGHVYWKKNNINTKRRNNGPSYFGIIKIKVNRSSGLLRQVFGWTKGIYKGINKGSKKYWGVV